MKKEIADIWVAALRSGKYKQERNALKKDGGFCCLGVLCTLAPNDIGEFDEDSFTWEDGSEDAELPTPVMDWSGVQDNCGMVNGNDLITLTGMNDGSGTQEKKSFAEIADFIEQNWEKL